jgi:hypothetical protein
MQVIEAVSTVSRADRLAVARTTVFGLILLGGGAAIAWVVVTTPLVGSFVPEGRPTIVQAGAGMLVWALAIIAPTGLMILGVVRLFRAWEGMTGLRPTGFTRLLARSLGGDHVAVVNL